MAEKIGLMVFPEFDRTHVGDISVHEQRLEPSVLYMAPEIEGVDVEFIGNNEPRADIDTYLCSVYTRGLKQFKEFSQRVGKDKIIAGGYHPSADPVGTLPYADKVVPGLCGNIEDIIQSEKTGIINGVYRPRPMRRDLVDMTKMAQVFPDVMPGSHTGSSNSSVGCPFNCDFCSTPNISGRTMYSMPLEHVERDIADLKSYGTEVVFMRDESFATHPLFKEVVPLYGAAEFPIIYSFGTGNAMNEEKVRLLADNNWSTLCFGLEDVGKDYRKNKHLARAVELCHRFDVGVSLSFIVNDDKKTKEEATANYHALYQAFSELQPVQVCANFIMPFPGTGIWDQYKDRMKEEDFESYDSKTPLLCDPKLRKWHQHMMVAVQLAYYYSDRYPRNFESGDTQHLRFLELAEQYDMADGKWERYFKPA